MEQNVWDCNTGENRPETECGSDSSAERIFKLFSEYRDKPSSISNASRWELLHLYRLSVHLRVAMQSSGQCIWELFFNRTWRDFINLQRGEKKCCQNFCKKYPRVIRSTVWKRNVEGIVEKFWTALLSDVKFVGAKLEDLWFTNRQ